MKKELNRLSMKGLDMVDCHTQDIAYVIRTTTLQVFSLLRQEQGEFLVDAKQKFKKNHFRHGDL